MYEDGEEPDRVKTYEMEDTHAQATVLGVLAREPLVIPLGATKQLYIFHLLIKTKPSEIFRQTGLIDPTERVKITMVVSPDCVSVASLLRATPGDVLVAKGDLRFISVHMGPATAGGTSPYTFRTQQIEISDEQGFVYAGTEQDGSVKTQQMDRNVLSEIRDRQAEIERDEIPSNGTKALDAIQTIEL